MAKLEYSNDVTGSFQPVLGSDGRLNVSSRADARAYYNSRDEEQCYSLVYDHQEAAAGEFSCYFKNESPDKTLVISSIGVNAEEAARIELYFVTGTATGGATITAVNLNKSSSKAAVGSSLTGTSGSGISGLTEDGKIDAIYVQALGHDEFRLTDRVRLGQNDAIAIKYAEGTTGDFGGVVFGYFE